VVFAFAASDPSVKADTITRKKAAEVLPRMNTPDNAVRIV
jgi:hypothetical protein